jgi:hypothetical protein
LWTHCRYLVDCGAIKPLCDLLSTPDVRIVTVALEGLENILKVRLGVLVLLQARFGTDCVLMYDCCCASGVPGSSAGVVVRHAWGLRAIVDGCALLAAALDRLASR